MILTDCTVSVNFLFVHAQVVLVKHASDLLNLDLWAAFIVTDISKSMGRIEQRERHFHPHFFRNACKLAEKAQNMAYAFQALTW